MFKNILKKLFITGSIIAIAGMLVSPTFAMAKENEKENHGKRSAISEKYDDNKGNDNDLGFGIGLFNGNSVVRSAAKVYKQAVKDADKAYKNARKTAHDKLVGALNTASDQTSRISALKTYLSDLMAALKQKSAAKELALQNFINALSGNQTNQAPTAVAQSVTLSKNTSKAITLTGTDPENSALTFFVVTNPTHGTLSGLVPNLTYMPNTDFTGTDSFIFKVNDGSQDSAPATVSITVNP